MTVLGIGVDIVRTARFAEIFARSATRFRRLQSRVLHPTELNADLPPTAQIQQLASSWAAKEALFKSLSVSQQARCVFSEWRRIFTPHRAQVLLCDHTEFQLEEWLVSISHDGEYTVAYVIRQAKPRTSS